jgi:arginase family enzyme
MTVEPIEPIEEPAHEGGSGVVLLGIPLDANSSHRFGCAEGPAAIRAALHSGSGNSSTERGHEVLSHLDDVGDLAITNTAGTIDDADRVTQAADGYLESGRHIISLGGDHSITFPILRAFGRYFDDLTVVHIDAHPLACRITSREGSPSVRCSTSSMRCPDRSSASTSSS